MDRNYLNALHQFLTATGAISHSHVVIAAQDEEWASNRIATLRGKFQAALDEMDTLDPNGAGLRGGSAIEIKLPGRV